VRGCTESCSLSAFTLFLVGVLCCLRIELVSTQSQGRIPSRLDARAYGGPFHCGTHFSHLLMPGCLYVIVSTVVPIIVQFSGSRMGDWEAESSELIPKHAMAVHCSTCAPCSHAFFTLSFSLSCMKCSGADDHPDGALPTDTRISAPSGFIQLPGFSKRTIIRRCAGANCQLLHHHTPALPRPSFAVVFFAARGPSGAASHPACWLSGSCNATTGMHGCSAIARTRACLCLRSCVNYPAATAPGWRHSPTAQLTSPSHSIGHM
jgi:hypothetical protein